MVTIRLQKSTENYDKETAKMGDTLTLIWIFTFFVLLFARPEPENLAPVDNFGLQTANVTAHICPFLCVLNGQYTCVPPPCPLPPCVDATKAPLECCEHCPNGIFCSKFTRNTNKL